MEKLFVQAPPRAAQIALPPRAVVPVKTFQHQQRAVARGAEEVAEGRERERLVVGKISAHERAGAHVDLAVQAEPRRKRDQLAAGEQALEHTLRLGAVLCVKAGEHGIQILAPCPKRKWMDHDKIDPATGLPVKDENGNTMQERTIITIPRYRVVTVFDVSQTEGKELPSLGVAELYGDVPNYQCIYDRLAAFSPVPVSIEPIAQSGAKGYFSDREQRIVLRSGMSEVQTVKTLMHEIAHAVLHNAERLQETGKKTRGQKEVEAESVAYVVCRHFGIDVSDYSFGYVAGWSRSKELRELHEALNTIRKTAAEIIDAAAVPTREHERKQKIYSH